MARKGWEKMVKRYLQKVKGPDAGFLYPTEAAKILARQHAAVVRLVKKLPRILCATTRGNLVETVPLDDLLAALETHRKGRT